VGERNTTMTTISLAAFNESSDDEVADDATVKTLLAAQLFKNDSANTDLVTSQLVFLDATPEEILTGLSMAAGYLSTPTLAQVAAA